MGYCFVAESARRLMQRRLLQDIDVSFFEGWIAGNEVFDIFSADRLHHLVLNIRSGGDGNRQFLERAIPNCFDTFHPGDFGYLR